MCIAGAVALAGCSSGSSKTDAQELGPLDQYWAALSDGQDWDQAAFEKQEQETQALIAQCMAKEGFEYKPNTVGSGMVTFGGDDEESCIAVWIDSTSPSTAMLTASPNNP